MATSELSADLGYLEVNGSDGHDGMNVDEVLEAAVDEAANSQRFNEERREYLQARNLENIPANVYFLSRKTATDKEES